MATNPNVDPKAAAPGAAPEGKKSKWWLWVIIILIILGLIYWLAF